MAPKVCTKCGVTKEEEEFYLLSDKVHRNGSCRDCYNQHTRDRRRLNPETTAEIERRRHSKPARRARVADRTRRWRTEHPDGARAQSAVHRAVRAGKLIKQPCLFCARQKVHAHHNDYSKPLEVIWLCPRCHHRLHAAFPQIEGHGPAEAV